MGSINTFKFNSRFLKCLDNVGILFFQNFRFCRSKEILIIKDLSSGNLLILGILSDLCVELSVTAYEVRICIKDVGEITLKNFDRLVFTLGYPKADDTERRLTFKNPKIRIGTGRPEWGAEPGKLYFVITWSEM